MNDRTNEGTNRGKRGMDLFSHFTYTGKATNLLFSRLKKASGSSGHNNQRITIQEITVAAGTVLAIA